MRGERSQVAPTSFQDIAKKQKIEEIVENFSLDFSKDNIRILLFHHTYKNI